MKRCILALALCALCFSSFAFESGTLQNKNEIHSKTDAPEDDTSSGAKPIKPSREVDLKKGEYLDIEYPGTGWMYLGDNEGMQTLQYSLRKLQNDVTTFILRASKEGKVVLHFYKNDVLTGKAIDDYLSVSIQGVSKTASHIKAPSYADIVPPRPSFTQSEAVALAKSAKKEAEAPRGSITLPTVSTPAATEKTTPEKAVHTNIENADATATVISTTTAKSNASQKAAVQTTESSVQNLQTSADKDKTNEETENLSEEEILSLAQKAFDTKDYKKCLSYLAAFFEKSVSRTDEGLYLEGQALEAPSAARNIKRALAVYQQLVEGFPQSEQWESAKQRITYIERIYFQIR